MPGSAATVTDVRIDGREARVVACPLCGTPEVDTVFSRHGFAYQRCRRCDLVRVNPQLTQAAIAGIYEVGYAGKSRAVAAVDTPLSAAERAILDTLERDAGGRGRLLDVGCFQGRLVRAAAHAGWQAVGTEISPEAVSHARRAFDLDVRLGALEDIHFPDAHFDAVVLVDVIEHLPDPPGTMREVHRILRPGGVVYLWTPNFDCVTRRAMGRKWGAVVFPWHLYYFTAGTLEGLATATGFSPLRATTRNLLLDFRDRYAALQAGRTLPRQPKWVRRARRILDLALEPFFAWSDRRGWHWGAQIDFYARKTIP